MGCAVGQRPVSCGAEIKRRGLPHYAAQLATGESVAEGDRVASVFTMTRTHRIEGGGDKVIVTEGVDLFQIADGRIHRINAYFDRLGFLVAMGILSPPP
jgi:ketosteroid isomerase-like protein